MNAGIILDPTYPHGTPEGYVTGCKGSHCPAPVKCRDVHVRYSGDYSYRKAIDAGTTAIELAAREQEAAQAAVEARRAAIRHAATQRYNETRRRKRATVRRASSYAGTKHDEQIRALHTQGLLDREIGNQLGLERRTITTIRNRLQLAPHHAINLEAIRDMHAAGMTDRQMADRINETRPRKVSRASVWAVRNRLGLACNSEQVAPA